MLRISYTFFIKNVKNEVFYINVFNIATQPKAIRKYGEFDYLTGECNFHSLGYHTKRTTAGIPLFGCSQSFFLSAIFLQPLVLFFTFRRRGVQRNTRFYGRKLLPYQRTKCRDPCRRIYRRWLI